VDGLDEFFAAVPEAEVLHALPDGVSVSFDLRGDGGGTWTVSRDAGRTEIRRKLAPRPDCHVRCTVADFRALVRGELDPRRGFLEGRLAVEGDVGLVLRLQRTVGR
jgi:putative sterol carrier protein